MKHLFILLMIATLAMAVGGAALGESYTAASMRLLHYEGTVEILDETGSPRFIMENARLNSGEAVRTGVDGTASIGLDAEKVLTLDADSRVDLIKQGNALKLTLAEGGAAVTTLGVLEGTAQVTWKDDAGATRTEPVSAGSKAVAAAETAGVEIAELAREDLPEFVNRELNEDAILFNRSAEALDFLLGADGDWTWDGQVTLVAQSASKLYDGEALTRPGDVLVYGLPQSCSIHVMASGRQVDAGEGSNPIGSYTIYNAMGEDVTPHFTHIETVSGQLVVDPLPLIIWTGSAEKEYDGTPLTNPETALRSVPGYERDLPPWHNTSYVNTEALGSQTLYALCGTVWVHGTNPLTGETREIQLRVGQKMEVRLSDAVGDASIELLISEVNEFGLPTDILRVYADNPDLLATACAEAGWDPEIIVGRLAQLPAGEDATVEKNGLVVEETSYERVMRDTANVRITIDSQITSYNGRALSQEEARFAEVAIDDTIVVTATGSQTEVGSSPNTYAIDWGSANPANYVVGEELGTLTVYAPTIHDEAVVLSSPSASKVYDGTPLTAPGVSASGLPEGYAVYASATGSRTDVGSAANTIGGYTILNEDGADVTDQFTNVSLQPGTLTVERLRLNVDLGGTEGAYGETAAPKASLSYGNGAHAGESVAGEPAGMLGMRAATPPVVTKFTLFTGKAVMLRVSGAGSDAGTYTLAADFIFPDGGEGNFAVSTTGTEYTVLPAALTIATGSGSKAYDGTPLTDTAGPTVTGHVAEADTLVFGVIPSITDVGWVENTVGYYFNPGNAANYDITTDFGTLTVTPLTVNIGAIGYEAEYDGSWFTPDGFTGTCEGWALEFENYDFQESADGATISAYATLPGGSVKVQCAGVREVGKHTVTPGFIVTDGKASNYNITTENTTMTITEPVKAILTLNVQGVTYDYDGTPHGPENVTASWSGPFSSVTLRSSEMTTGEGGLPRLVVEYNVSGDFGYNVVSVECQWQLDSGTYELPTNYAMSGDGGIELRFTNTTMKIR